jgi:aspartoacylase
MKNNISSVLLVGGTHGNELTGVHCIKHFKESNFAEYFSDIKLNYLMANPKAIEENKRYCDQDLNRSFKPIDLADNKKNNREQSLAKKINQIYGSSSNNPVDFIIDLHTSTANMQTNIVLTKTDLFHLQLAAYLQSVLPDVVITSESELMDEHHFLESIAPKGVLIEIGPIPQGCLDYECFEKTKGAVIACLEFVQHYNLDFEIDSGVGSENKHNNKVSFDFPNEIEIMNYTSKIYFPLNEKGEIKGCVHPTLIGKAYPQIKKGDAIFKLFDGSEIFYEGETTYCAFINEAAYYDQKIAMCLCNPKMHSMLS